MNLGFKDQFVPFVEDGSKTHSIRAGERWRVGMRADCYARPRQKGMRLLFRAPVVRVEEIRVRAIDDLLALGVPLHKAVIVTVDGIGLDDDELDAFAWRDGFRVGQSGYGAQMMAFWAKAHDLRNRDFHGQIVHWDYARRRTEKEIWPKDRQHPCEYIDPATLYDPPFGGTR